MSDKPTKPIKIGDVPTKVNKSIMKPRTKTAKPNPQPSKPTKK